MIELWYLSDFLRQAILPRGSCNGIPELCTALLTALQGGTFRRFCSGERSCCDGAYQEKQASGYVGSGPCRASYITTSILYCTWKFVSNQWNRIGVICLDYLGPNSKQGVAFCTGACLCGPAHGNYYTSLVLKSPSGVDPCGQIKVSKQAVKTARRQVKAKNRMLSPPVPSCPSTIRLSPIHASCH